MSSQVAMYITSQGKTIKEGGCSKAQREWFQKFLKDHPAIKKILEIGFNAGEGAEAILDSRSDITMTSVDIGRWDYTSAGKECIDKEFPGRHTLVLGDSKKVLAEIKGNFDLIYIDGCHSGEHPYWDIKNCKMLSNLSTVLILNDFGTIHGRDVKTSWEKALQEGIVSAEGELVDHKWWVGSYNVKRVVMVNAYNRFDYLDRVLGSLAVCGELDKWEVCYYQDGLKEGGFCKQTADVANKWLDIIEKKAKRCSRVFHTDNKNIGIRQFASFQNAFFVANADVVLVLEDDTVISPTYLITTYNLLKYAEKHCPTVGYVSGNYAEETAHKDKYDICIGIGFRRQITWATGHLRRNFLKMFEKYKVAHQELFINKSYLKHTKEEMEEAKRDYNRVFDMLGMKRNNCFSQDAVQLECYRAVGFEDVLYPTLRHALPIGERGLHFTPEIFKKHRLDNTTWNWLNPPWTDSMNRTLSGLK